jgi:hypothetical protein
MKYYITENRIAHQNFDEQGNLIGQVTKEPIFMKKYAYYKIAFSPDFASKTLLQSYDDVEELIHLSLEEAQQKADEWCGQGVVDVKSHDTFEMFTTAHKLHEEAKNG